MLPSMDEGSPRVLREYPTPEVSGFAWISFRQARLQTPRAPPRMQQDFLLPGSKGTQRVRVPDI